MNFHIISPLAGLTVSNKPDQKLKNVVGFDSNKIYTLNDAKKKQLEGDATDRPNLKYEEDLCLAFSQYVSVPQVRPQLGQSRAWFVCAAVITGIIFFSMEELPSVLRTLSKPRQSRRRSSCMLCPRGSSKAQPRMNSPRIVLVICTKEYSVILNARFHIRSR